MQYQRILLTGSTGTLGQAIVKTNRHHELIACSLTNLDIKSPTAIASFFSDHDFDAVIHCAAIAKMAICENDPILGIQTNIIGTANLVAAVLKKEQCTKKPIRFIHISTDGVYNGKDGAFRENSPTIPYNRYGWTKLGAECAVNQLINHCIIRTSFFDPSDIRFTDSPTDAFSSKLPILELASIILKIAENSFIGTINIGDVKKSDFDRYREFKPELKPCNYEAIASSLPFTLAQDASLDLSLWNKLKLEFEDE